MKRNTVSLKLILSLCFIVLSWGSCTIQRTTSSKNEKETLEKKAPFDIKAEYAFAEATRQKLFGNLDEAIVLYTEAIRLNPGNAAAYYELSNIYQYLRETDLAVEYAGKAHETDQENIWYMRHLAGLYHMKGDKEKTIRIYEKMKEKYPGRYEIGFDLALLYRENGQIQQALRILDEIEEKMGVNDMVNTTKYGIYESENRLDRAIKELEKLIAAFPGEPKYLGLLAETYDEMGNSEKAEEVYGKLFEIDPDNGKALMSVASFYERLGKMEKSFGYMKRGFRSQEIEPEEKLQSLIFLLNREEMLAEHRQSIDELIVILEEEYPSDIRVMTLRADYYLRLQKLEEASEILQKVLKINAENYALWEQLIFIENELENYTEMVKFAGEAIRHYPGETRLYYYKCIGEYLLKQYDSLVVTASEAIKNTDRNHELHVEFLTLLGEAYHGKKMHTESDGAFDEALKMRPDDLHVLNNYSYYLSLRGEKLEMAQEYSSKTIRAEPENHTYLDTYAWILYKRKKYEEALKYIEMAIINGGDGNSVIVEHYGDILFMNGEKEKAVDQWKKAVKLGGDEEEIQKKIRDGIR